RRSGIDVDPAPGPWMRADIGLRQHELAAIGGGHLEYLAERAARWQRDPGHRERLARCGLAPDRFGRIVPAGPAAEPRALDGISALGRDGRRHPLGDLGRDAVSHQRIARGLDAFDTEMPGILPMPHMARDEAPLARKLVLGIERQCPAAAPPD